MRRCPSGLSSGGHSVGYHSSSSTMTRRSRLCMTLLMMASSVHPQSATVVRLPSKLRLAAQDPGCAVSVTSHGHTVLARGYGVTDVNRGSPIDARTNFRLASSASSSRQATILLMQDGRFTYDTTLAEMLPGFPGLRAPCHRAPSPDSYVGAT